MESDQQKATDANADNDDGNKCQNNNQQPTYINQSSQTPAHQNNSMKNQSKQWTEHTTTDKRLLSIKHSKHVTNK